jgi:hypothetical protein
VPLTSELSEAIVPIQHLIPFYEGKAVEQVLAFGNTLLDSELEHFACLLE